MKATTAIPLFPRLTLAIVEPLMCLNGVLVCLQNPQKLIANYLTHGAVSYAPLTQTIFNQLAGFWLFFAFIEFFVLRSFDDLRLWKRICIGFLSSDAVCFWVAAQAVGGWTAFLDVEAWYVDDWVVNLAVLWSVSMRLFVVFGV